MKILVTETMGRNLIAGTIMDVTNGQLHALNESLPKRKRGKWYTAEDLGARRRYAREQAAERESLLAQQTEGMQV